MSFAIILKHQATSVPVQCSVFTVQFSISHCVLNVWITAAKRVRLYIDFYNIILLNLNGSHARLLLSMNPKPKRNETKKKDSYNLHWTLDNGSTTTTKNKQRPQMISPNEDCIEWRNKKWKEYITNTEINYSFMSLIRAALRFGAKVSALFRTME